MLIVIMLNVTLSLYAECSYAEWHYAECRGAIHGLTSESFCVYEAKLSLFQCLFQII